MYSTDSTASPTSETLIAAVSHDPVNPTPVDPGSELAKTGDSAVRYLFGAMLLAAAGIGCLGVFRYRRR